MSNYQHRNRRLPDPETRPTLTVRESALYLGVAPRTLYDAVNRGEFECIRIRSRVVISTRYLLDLLDPGISNE